MRPCDFGLIIFLTVTEGAKDVALRAIEGFFFALLAYWRDSLRSQSFS